MHTRAPERNCQDGLIRALRLHQHHILKIDGKPDRMEVERSDGEAISIQALVHPPFDEATQRLVNERDGYQRSQHV